MWPVYTGCNISIISYPLALIATRMMKLTLPSNLSGHHYQTAQQNLKEKDKTTETKKKEEHEKREKRKKIKEKRREKRETRHCILRKVWASKSFPLKIKKPFQ
jgi:hypothetical protein